MSKPVSQKLNVSPIQLNNTRVLSDTYDKLLIVITKEVAGPRDCISEKKYEFS